METNGTPLETTGKPPETLLSIEDVCKELGISDRTLRTSTKELSEALGKSITQYEFKGKTRYIRYTRESVELLRDWRINRTLPTPKVETAIVPFEEVLELDFVPPELFVNPSLAVYDTDARMARLSTVDERLELNEVHLHDARLKQAEMEGAFKELQVIDAEKRGAKRVREMYQYQQKAAIEKPKKRQS